MEAEKFKREAFEESIKHWEAEKIAIKAIRRVRSAISWLFFVCSLILGSYMKLMCINQRSITSLIVL